MNERNSLQLVATKYGKVWKLSILRGLEMQKNYVVYFESYNSDLIAEILVDAFRREECRAGKLDRAADDFRKKAVKILERCAKEDIKPFRKALEKLEDLPTSDLVLEAWENMMNMKKFLKLEITTSIVQMKRRDEREL